MSTHSLLGSALTQQVPEFVALGVSYLFYKNNFLLQQPYPDTNLNIVIACCFGGVTVSQGSHTREGEDL